jgi:hypothetical protein
VDESRLEEQLRAETTCRGCGGQKALGQLVCWGCFKRRTDVTPLKDWTGGIRSWLEMVEKARS